MNPAYKLVLLSLPLTLAACSVLEGDKVDYKSSVKATPLSVPPDLTQLPRDNRYATPGVTVSATGFQNATQASGQNAVASTFPGLRIEGHGLQRWLAVDLPPEKIWPVLKSFWEELGLEIILDDAKLGIMETNWAENRAKLPQDFFRRTFGKVLDSLSSTNQLDKYRTRLERHASGGTEIYISHRGLDEVFRDDQRIKMAWQIRPSEPELEYEMLRRLMLKLGAPSIQSEQIIAAGRQTTRLDSREGQPIVIISEGFDRAWRRVGLTLDRTGFTVEDRDRSQGTYFVRYVEPNPPGYEEPGFFARLFGAASRDKTPQKYRILVRGEADSATVSVLNTEGQPEMSGNAQRILKVISDDLR